MTAQTPPALADRLTVSPDVVFRELEGEAVLLDLESGTYFGLNAVGTRIWSLIQERDSLRAVLDAITDEYDAMPEALLLRAEDRRACGAADPRRCGSTRACCARCARCCRALRC